jgi:hypothetical protein
MATCWGGATDERRWWVRTRKGWQLVKPWHQSRTVWVNVIGAALELLNGHSAQLLEPWLLYLALAVLNILLRFATDEPIRLFR